MKPESIKTILVIRFSSLGDIILTTPLLSLTRRAFPDATIDYLTKKEYSPILKSNPNISRLIEADGNISFSELRSLKRTLKAHNYDLILDAHNNLRTFYLRQFTAKHKLVFRKYSFRKFLLVKFKINKMMRLPGISRRYSAMLGNITAIHPENFPQPQIFIDNESVRNVDSILQDAGVNDQSTMICIVPSSNHFTKTYQPAQFITLAEKLSVDGYTILLCGKGNDRKNIIEIKSAAGKKAIDLCDKLSLTELTEVMNRCKIVIAGDTGPMHIAEALNKPLIMIAGSSVREFGFYPQNEKAVIVENNNLKCRPCSHIGRSECPLGHFKCMKVISPQTIYENAVTILST